MGDGFGNPALACSRGSDQQSILAVSDELAADPAADPHSARDREHRDGDRGAVGPAVGTYVTSVDNSDASYTLHFITTDAAGNVVSHTTETYNADGTVTTGTVPGSTGEALGDIMGGVTDSSFYSDPMGCLSFYCDGGSGDPFSDPYSLLSTSFGSNGW